MTLTILACCPRCGQFECDYIDTTEKYQLTVVKCRNCKTIFVKDEEAED